MTTVSSLEEQTASTPARKAVPKRLRFEIMRRDNHACRYCGAAAPDAKLTVDHVVPVVLGGSNEPTNLVTACTDCNAGKAATSPDSPIVEDVRADAHRWALAVRATVETYQAELDTIKANRDRFEQAWNRYTVTTRHWDREAQQYVEEKGSVYLPHDWPNSVDRFFELGVTSDLLDECVRIAMQASGVDNDRVWRYFCGVAWKRVHEIQEVAVQVANHLADQDKGGK